MTIYATGPTGVRTRFDYPGEVPRGWQIEEAARAAQLPPPMAPIASFKSGDTILLDGKPYVLKAPGKPGRPKKADVEPAEL